MGSDFVSQQLLNSIRSFIGFQCSYLSVQCYEFVAVCQLKLLAHRRAFKLELNDAEANDFMVSVDSNPLT
jgi:hypothetical protein